MSAVSKSTDVTIITRSNTTRKRRRRSRNRVNNAKSRESGPKIASKSTKPCTTNKNKRKRNRKVVRSSLKSASKSLSLQLNQKKSLFLAEVAKILKQVDKEAKYGTIKFRGPRSKRSYPKLYETMDIKLFRNKTMTIDGTQIPIGSKVVFCEGIKEYPGELVDIDYQRSSIKICIPLDTYDKTKVIDRTIYLYQLQQKDTYFRLKSSIRR